MTEEEIKRQFEWDHLLKEQDNALVSLENAKKRYADNTSQIKELGLLSYKEFCDSFAGKCFGSSDSNGNSSENYLKVLGHAEYKYCNVLYVKKNSVTVEKIMLNENFFNKFKQIPKEDFTLQLTNRLAEFLTY